ncbi:MAG TPA: NAD-dependent epimerase/dehydratase family protein [Acidobacteriota bacterium]|nr:NAD-dependent epimerase/dehydratase family protein [Acidobacteriota bacterium]
MPTRAHSPDVPGAKTVFVTGANGFVGSHLARSLVAAGHQVRALVRPQADRALVADLPIEWVGGDLDDRDALRAGCDGADWVAHVAGRVKAPDRQAFFHANETGTRNLLESAIEAAPQLERFVYVSSLAAGGPVYDGQPRSESDPDHPITDYGESKLAGEKVAMSYADRFPVVTVRPPAVYGPGDREVLGFFKAVRWHIKPVFGGRTMRLSLVYVTNLVDGIMLTLTSPAAPGEVFYVADDRLYSLAELEDMMQHALGNWALRVNIPRPLLTVLATAAEWAGRVGGFVPSLNRSRARDFVERDWACTVDKARRMMGYVPQVEFAEGAVRTVAWYREHRWL